MIAIPSMLMMMAIFYLWRTIHGLTGLRLEDIMASGTQEQGGSSNEKGCPARAEQPF